MKYPFQKQCRDHLSLRKSFDHLARETFGISFEAWYQAGYWTQRYCPYSLVDQGIIIANASVNLMDFRWQKETYRYIQIGTVMTHPAYQGQGCASFLLETIKNDWKENCDGMYLYANPAAASFYEAHGFQRVKEYEYRCRMQPSPNDFQRLDIKLPEHLALVKRCYAQGNPYAALTTINSFSLLMFYCSKDDQYNIYYSKKQEVICILQEGPQQLICLAFFGKAAVRLQELLNELPASYPEVILGFTPKDTAHMIEQEREELVFVWCEKETIFTQAHLQTPLLSHA